MTNAVEAQAGEKPPSRSAENAYHSASKMVTESNEHAYSQPHQHSGVEANKHLVAQGVLPTVHVDAHESKAPQDQAQLHTGQRASEFLGSERFAAQALRLLPQLDTNHDGRLSPQELKNAMQNPQFKGVDAEVVAGLYKAEAALQNPSGLHAKETGISAEDISSFDKLYPKEMLATQREQLLTDFNSLDTNHDGRLSKDELTAATRISDKDAAIAKFFLDNFDQAHDSRLDISNIWASGLSATDITKFRFTNEDKVSNAIDQINQAMGDVYKHQDNVRSDRLWGEGDDFRANIRPEAISQGDIGDCFLLSSMAAVAKFHPEMIHDMIKPEKNGYRVTFPGDKEHSVFVTAPTEAEQGLGNSPSKYGSWSGVLEKAYGQYLEQYKGKSSQLDPAEAANDGGHLTEALNLLTGQNFVYNHFNNDGWQNPFNHSLISDDRLNAILSSASSGPVCCGTIDGSKDKDYPSDHAYTVVGFDPKGNNGAGAVIVRNPWGSNADNHTGLSTMTFAQFKQRFNEIAYQSQK